MVSLRSVLATAIGILFVGGCAANKPAQTHRLATTTPATHPLMAKPIVDFGHGAAGFPLVNHVPIDSSRHLQEELTAGYAARVQMPTTRPTVTVVGEFPKLKSLVIDLSGGEIKAAYRPTSLKGVDRTTKVSHVDRMQYIADPLSFEGSSQHLTISASDVTLSLLHGRGEKEVLVMSDAGSGEAKFDATLADLNTLLNASAKEHGSSGFFVMDTKLTMSSDNPRSLIATLRIQGFFLVIPTTLTISGRIDIDSDFQATMSDLHCVGSDVGGPIAAKFINDKLQKYNGKKQPLATFPGDRMKMRDVRISVDDALHVDAMFGR